MAGAAVCDQACPSNYVRDLWRQPAASPQAQTGQSPPQNTRTGSATESAPDNSLEVTVFSHPEDSRWWLSRQINISPGHASFPADHSGANSFQPQAQVATSLVFTLYAGAALTSNTQAILDVESAGGRGLSGGAGIAGFPNLDIVRTPDLGQTPYWARFLLERTIPLGGGTVKGDRDFLSLSTSLPARRLEHWAGKLGTVDFFDENSMGGAVLSAEAR